MRDYSKDYFERANLGQLLNFIKYGVECLNESNEPYIIRLENSSKEIRRLLNEKHPTFEEYNEIEKVLTHAFSVYEEVYLEIGVKMGAKLIYQLLLDDSK